MHLNFHKFALIFLLKTGCNNSLQTAFPKLLNTTIGLKNTYLTDFMLCNEMWITQGENNIVGKTLQQLRTFFRA